MSGGETFQLMLSFLSSCVESFPDHRTDKNTHFSLRDVTRGAFGVFFCQGPPFLAFQEFMQQHQGKNNARACAPMRSFANSLLVALDATG
jgi:hypothetical protein